MRIWEGLSREVAMAANESEEDRLVRQQVVNKVYDISHSPLLYRDLKPLCIMLLVKPAKM